jgi:hemoglobin
MWSSVTGSRSLYDRIGGADAVKPAVTLLYRRVLDDPVLAGYFRDVDIGRLRAHQRAFVSAVLGGPELFVGRPLEVAHANLHIDDRAFDAMIDHLVAALRDLGVDETTAGEVAEEFEPLRPSIVTPASPSTSERAAGRARTGDV